MCGVMYRIKDWDKFFENNKSRIVDQCSFVCVPNKQDGMGLTRILSTKNGASIYGIWCLVVGACSRQRKPRLGYLTDDGTAEGNPWDAEDLANRWRQPVDLIADALAVLSSSRIGWLEHSPSQVPSKCPSSAAERSTKEGRNERTEGMNGRKEELTPDKPSSDLRNEEGSTRATADGKAERSTSPTDPVKAQPKRKVGDSDHARLVAHWCASWERIYGVEYHFVGPRDGKQIKWILTEAKSLEQATKIIDAYFSDRSQFLSGKCHPMSILVSQFSTYAAHAKKARTVDPYSNFKTVRSQ